MSEVNVILDILKSMLLLKPESDFIKSLYDQYCNRGGLSKKQLEGLHSKASKTAGIPPGKLATLEAIIKKILCSFELLKCFWSFSRNLVSQARESSTAGGRRRWTIRWQGKMILVYK